MKKHWTVSRKLMRQHLSCTKNNNLEQHLYGVYMQTIHNEEADTRLLLNAKHAASDFTRIVVQFPDTDVLVICCSQFSSLGCDELWFHTGTRDKTQYIPMHCISLSIGSSLCKALPGFHELTGCDSTSSFYGIGKKKAGSVMEKSSEFQTALGRFGQTIALSKKLAEVYEKIVCRFFTSAPLSGTTVNDLRHWLFCQKCYTNENLPPTHDSLTMHLKRANFQSMVWVRCLQPKQ